MIGKVKNSEKKKSKKIYIETALYLLAVSLCVAIFFVTKSIVLYFPLFAVASAFFGMAMSRGGQSLGMIYLVFISVVLFFFTDKLWELLLLISVFLPAGTAFFLNVNFKKSFNSSIASSFLASAVFTMVIFTVFIWENSNPFSFDIAFSSIFSYIKEVLAFSFDNGISDIVSMGRDEYISSMFSQFLSFAPVIYSLAVLVSLVISSRIVKYIYSSVYGKDEKTLEFFGKLKYFRLSIAGGIFYILSNIVYIFTDSESTMGLFLGIFVSVMSYIFIFEGIAVLISFMSIKEVKKPLRIIVCVISAVLCLIPYGFISYIFTLAGLMDCFYNIRKNFNGKGGRIL